MASSTLSSNLPPSSPQRSGKLFHANQLLEDAQEELQLLEDTDNGGLLATVDSFGLSPHDLATAPLITRDAYVHLNDAETQYGLLGKIISIHRNNELEESKDRRMYLNTNAPFSSIICGVQGSGKSHTVSTMLENMLIPNFSPIGSLRKPLAGVVLHFGEGGASSLPNETAYLSRPLSSVTPGVPVKVYVSRSSLKTMRRVYSDLGPKVTVEPLLLRNEELDAAAMLSMMAVGSSESAPLYMQIILSILRDLGEGFSYSAFLDQLEKQKPKLSPAQVGSLEQRMLLLQSFLEPTSSSKPKSKNKQPAPTPRFQAGQLTIIDLSDPFLDTASACGMFEIIVRLFVRARTDSGKFLVVDEAHKYLSPDQGASGLTTALLQLIRQQRHLSMRVIISTQEPTVVPPVLIDLCSVVILHRFSSPKWWDHIIKHVPADFCRFDAFDKVVRLQTGHAIVLAPSGIGIFYHPGSADGAVEHIGRRYLIMKTRQRVTTDGGVSLLVVGKDK